MIEQLINLARLLHPWAWHDAEIIVAVTATGMLVWLSIDWSVDRIFVAWRRHRTRRVLRERSRFYADPALVARTDAARRLASHREHGAASAGTAGVLCLAADGRHAGYGEGTSLEADAVPEDRLNPTVRQIDQWR